MELSGLPCLNLDVAILYNHDLNGILMIKTEKRAFLQSGTSTTHDAHKKTNTCWCDQSNKNENPKICMLEQSTHHRCPCSEEAVGECWLGRYVTKMPKIQHENFEDVRPRRPFKKHYFFWGPLQGGSGVVLQIAAPGAANDHFQIHHRSKRRGSGRSAEIMPLS